VRLRKFVVAIAILAGGVAYSLPVTPVAAAGVLNQSWGVTVGRGPGSVATSSASAEPFAGATVGDLFGDGRKEVVAGFQDGSVWAFDGATGAVLPGWPQYTGGSMHTNPSLADLGNDGHQEVIATSESGRIYVWNGNGSLYPGWPQHTLYCSTGCKGVFGGVAVGDLFGDGNKELVAASWDHHLYAWNRYGTVLSGFPINVWDTAWDTPTLVDLEHRGQLDIVVGFDSSGPPWDPYPVGGEMWAFRPSGCPGVTYPTQSNCQIPGWPRTFDETPWASSAAADLYNSGYNQIVEGTGFNFAPPRGQQVNAWNVDGSTLGGWPQATTGQNLASPAIGDLFGDGSKVIVAASRNGLLYAWNNAGGNLGGWPLNLNSSYLVANPTIGPIGAGNQNGVWIISGQKLQAFNNSAQQVWTTAAMDQGGFAAPTIADLGTGGLSAVIVDQATSNSWAVRAFPIPGTTKMLPGAWPTFHGNSQLSGTLAPTATMSGLSANQNATGITLHWTLDGGSVAATHYAVWARDHAASAWMFYGYTSSTSMPFYGYPGHTYSFTVQAASAGATQDVSYTNNVVTTSFSGSATWSTPFKEMYGVDGFGALHPGSSAPVAGSTTWPGWDIARSVAVAPGGAGGYVLDGWGGVHPFGNAPQVNTTVFWSGWDIARAIVLRSDGHSGYVLDGWGGLHPFGISGDMPPSITQYQFWNGWDIARDLQLRPDGQSGYVLDGYGGVHPFAAANDTAPFVQTTAYWSGWDIAHRFVLSSSGNSGYVLDGWGGLHPFGTPGNVPAAPQLSAFWNGWDIARGVALLPGSSTQGYVIDGWGGFHPFGGAPSVFAAGFTPGGTVRDLGIG